ncbi:amino/aminoacylpeptidase, esterase/lipase superfamily protein [Psychroflexus gondwanensis ACAM 44]|uniref:Amino/aminoacylpeptidase, esterase/lipase superfamily protein n=1 Tax=Psychroflexus gondwanensis ACAM 44 TaxID=1189619 RepID=N1WTK1_9FLAO|nr:S9 family peptidase [Psychroflexus gondwanensis]EMY80449.1 amino/aminoacylpeptidase, esterase/lipase superfamily protein [Psychroflexus gondwanensis ACAM 44]
MYLNRISLVILLLLSLTMVNGQTINGDWSGKLNAMGQEIPLVIHFSGNDDNLAATMDSPSQGASDIPVEKVSLEGTQLSLSLMGGQIEYTAEVNGDSMTGNFKQGGMDMPLTLTKGELEKPGDTSLPSSEKELKALANNETGNYNYSVADYFAKPASSDFQLSPDGTYMSYREKDDNLKNHVYVKNIKTNQVKRVITEAEELIRGYGWANENRLIYIMDKGGNEDYHLFAVDIDGNNQKELTPYDGVKVEILALLKEDKNHMVISMNKNNAQVFDPYKINITTGELEQLYENTDITNPIMGYEFDKDGNLRGFARLKDGINSEFYYAVEPGDYKLMKTTKWDDTFSVISFDYASENEHDAYMVSNLNSDKTEIYKYDLAEDEVIEKLFSNENYDVSGASLSRNRNWELDYFSYEGEKSEIIPVSNYYKKLHKKLEKEFPGYNFYLSDRTDDESHYLIYVTSDKLYGKYYSYDVNKDEIKLLFDLMPQLKEKDMSEMRPISFKSRDGIQLHGYITLPKEAVKGQKVPVIVNPHGGPQGIRDSWGFNPEAQLFASRGYATLHVNFRISGGYGKEFLRSGFKQIGRKAMDDVEDGLQYVIDKGWVDKDKAAIYGGSHGGYAVLRGLTKTPDLYACGVDYVGVSNLFTFMETIPAYWAPYLPILKAVWYDAEVPEEKKIMEEVSPAFHIDKIKKPLFVVQGANDPRVNINESDQIVISLRDKGFDVPYMVKYDEGHGFAKEENRMVLYTTMMGFFAEQLK